MARPRQVDDAALIAALAGAFRETGYEGASLTRLADAAGLEKASLYHRFPGGKQEMADEVLAATFDWVGENIVAPLSSDAPAEKRLRIVAARLSEFYDCGRKACLLNLFSAPHGAEGPFAEAVRTAFETLIGAFAGVACDTGASPATARRRAETVVALLQGSLILSRGLGDKRPFKDFLASLPALILGAPQAPSRKTRSRP